MRFLIDKREYDFEPDPGASVKDFRLDASTSVNQLRAHFIEALGKIGEIQIVDETLAQEETGLLCARSDTIFASFHEQPQEGIACRILQHSKGALMLNGGFLDKWFLRDETTNIVTTERQADQLRRGLGDSAPNLGVFVPRIATDCFRMPSIAEKAGARQALEISCADFHMVYAGRWIANKGICQAVRALNHWPIQKARISLVGEFEPNFHISQSNALHVTFPSYFYREVCGRNRHVRIDLRKSVAQRQLSGIFQTADCFFYPSFHEDENFGMAPREAILCGVPSVVTDFCGLSQLGRITKGGLVETYPTLGGVRFSLLALHESIGDASANVRNTVFGSR
jgi:glycosyltransferase involved in cell wall biosynthesis